MKKNREGKYKIIELKEIFIKKQIMKSQKERTR